MFINIIRHWQVYSTTGLCTSDSQMVICLIVIHSVNPFEMKTQQYVNNLMTIKEVNITSGHPTLSLL